MLESCFVYENLNLEIKYIYIYIIDYLYVYNMINIIGENAKTLKDRKTGVPESVIHLNLSANAFQSGAELVPFKNLKTLIMDDNPLTTLEDFPIFKSLETFSANKNNFSDLDKFLDQAHDRFGNLKNLSLLKNPLNPFFEDEKKYAIYRDKVLNIFPKLKTLDGCAIQFMKKQIIQQKKQQQQKYQRLQAVAVFDEKYKNDQIKSVKTKSEGNRFIKKDQL